MSKLLWFFKITLLCYAFASQNFALSADLPPNWPWRGVSMGPGSSPKDIIRYHKKLNINMIQLYLKPHILANHNNSSYETAVKESVEWANSMLDECATLGITAVINISEFPTQRTAEFWANEESKRIVLDFTLFVVKQFKGRGRELAAYHVLSEPTVFINNIAKSPADWPQLFKSIKDTVRKEDPSRWLAVSPGPGGAPVGYIDFQNNIADAKIIWGVHMYMPHAFTHQGIRDRDIGVKYPGKIGTKNWNKNSLVLALLPLKKYQQRNGGLVWVGEFSSARWAEGGEQYIKDLVSIFEGYGWSWTYFSATGWHGWNPDYNTQYSGADSDSKTWEKNYQGDETVRWQTLHYIFNFK